MKFLLRLILGITTLGGASVAAAQEYLPAAKTTPFFQDDEPESKRSPDEIDVDLLAKQLDEFHQRIKELEEALEEKSEGDASEELEELAELVEENTDEIESLGSDISEMPNDGTTNSTMKIFGRIHADYWAFPEVQDTLFPLEGSNPDDRFIFRRVRIGAKGDITDNMYYKFETEMANGNNFEYRDVVLGFKNLPYLQTMIIGNHKRPYGLDHLNSSRYNIFIERPFIVESFNQDARRLGISSSGHSEDLCSNWRFGVWNQDLIQNTFGYVGDHYQLEFAARYARTAWWDAASDGRGYLHWAVSGSIGFPDALDLTPAGNQLRYRHRPEARTTNRWIDTGAIAGADDYSLGGFELVYNRGSFQFGGEWMVSQVDRLAAFGRDVRFHGGYFYLSYVLTGEHIPWDRKSGTLGRLKPFENFWRVRDCEGNIQSGLGAWEVAARFSYADLTDDNIIGGEATSLTLGMNWYWNQNARMQFNYILGDIERGAAGSGQYQIIGTRFMVDF